MEHSLSEALMQCLEDWEAAWRLESAQMLRERKAELDWAELNDLERLGEESGWLAAIEDLGRRGVRAMTQFRHDEDGPNSYLVYQALTADGYHEPYFFGIANRAAELAIARELIESIPDRERRVDEHLLSLLQKAKPNEQVTRFMRLLGRCYVAGLDAECVILCRSVVDAALKDTLPKEVLMKTRDLDTRIKAAKEILAKPRDPDDPSKRSPVPPTGDPRDAPPVKPPKWIVQADLVRQRGNTAVHEDPTATTNIFETLSFTVDILEELYGELDLLQEQDE